MQTNWVFYYENPFASAFQGKAKIAPFFAKLSD